MFNAPWKITNEITRLLSLPQARIGFAINGIHWGKHWRLHGVPIIQKIRGSKVEIGDGLGLRSTVRSNPLGPNRPVILCTWQIGAELKIGDNFGMTGGTICVAEKIIIGTNVTIGANTTIVDTDFHSLNPEIRRKHPQAANTAPIFIEDDVFIGMNCLILKGVKIGQGSVIGAGSVVTHDIPARSIAAGNPACVIGELPPLT